MKPDYESILVWAKAHKAAAAAVVLLALLIAVGVVSWLAGGIGSFFDWRFINKTNANINAEKEEANKVNANLANLALQNVNAQINVNLSNAFYNNSILKTNEERNITNQFIDNASRIRNANSNGASANTDAQCRAYPETCSR